MIFDTAQLIEAVRAAKLATGETYLSLKLDISDHGTETKVIAEWTSYTTRTGHTKTYATPAESLADTVLAASAPGKLIAQAEHFEREAEALRRRAGGLQ